MRVQSGFCEWTALAPNTGLLMGPLAVSLGGAAAAGGCAPGNQLARFRCAFLFVLFCCISFYLCLTAVPRADGLTLSGEGQPLRLGGRVSYLYCPFVFVCFLVLPAAGGSENQKFCLFFFVCLLIYCLFLFMILY